MMRFFLLVLSFFALFPVYCQDHNATSLVDRVNSNGTIPDDIRSGKSLLLITCDDGVDCSGWREIAAEVQPFLADCGVDAIATYYFGDILSGAEPFRTFMTSFENRNVTDLVIILQKQSGFEVILTAFDPKSFIDEDQPGWSTSAPDLRAAMTNTYRAVSSSGQKLRNLLILEVPEFGDMVDIFTGRRAEFYDLNFASDKLAVYPFADTAAIREVMANYPYKYEIIDPAIPENELRSEGFDFVLYYVHTRAENAKRLLGYTVSEKETSYVSESISEGKPVLKAYNRDTPVYKFYIKQVRTGNTFLGKKWDAAPEWEQALNNYIALLRNELLNN